MKHDPHPEPVDAFFPKDLAQAEVVKELLEANGIPSEIFAEAILEEGITIASPQTLGAGIRIRVPKDRLHDAQRALAAARETGKLMKPEDAEGA